MSDTEEDYISDELISSDDDFEPSKTKKPKAKKSPSKPKKAPAAKKAPAKPRAPKGSKRDKAAKETNGTSNGNGAINGASNGAALHQFSDSEDDMLIDDDPVNNNHAGASNGGNKRLSVERIYQKKTQLEHILLRPDTYIGSVEFLQQQMWVYDDEAGMILREVSFVPGLYKIFDEILVNAADNKQRDKNMNTIKIEIDPEANMISVYNNGKGIPVVMHKDEKVYVPTMIFGMLLTSSNYNDEERKVTGGRNGYGAKLCNIFSTKFIVETSSKEQKKQFKQVWHNNMSKRDDEIIKEAKGEDYTKITFYPDLAKFKMESLDKDFVSILKRRAYDIAGCTLGVKVYLNGKMLPVKNFKDYMDLYVKDKTDENDQPLKCFYERTGARWEIGITKSEHGFRQISFVNSIATTKGGRHVDYVVDQIVTKLAEAIKKRNKQGINAKGHQIKNYIWIFINCLIENPTFDSQTKENMTLQSKSFGSKCTPTEKFLTQVIKVGIVDSVLDWIKFKAQNQANSKMTGKKTNKIKNCPKLEDANEAGTKKSIDCTLILTEGDSAKTLVVAGFGVIGRDKYGCFPLRGKLLNVREASHKQISENEEINQICRIMGLQGGKKYETIDDLKTLRYGRLMIMTDQDQDGSHIKGLLINFIHHKWPSLLKLPFLEEFITPIVKATKGDQVLSFYSLPELAEWKQATPNLKTWKLKYYKGLGTSTSDEAKEYFSELDRNRIKFKYQGLEDDQSIELAFSKKMIEERKIWLTNSMEDRKRRRELQLPEVYLYEKGTHEVTYKDFVNKELILFSNADNERSIPSLMDGLKPGQRKIMFTVFKRKNDEEVKVAQLAGAVGEKAAYHHGEVSLMTTIVNLAQDFVGSNNIPLLLPLGQFGSRLQGGKDSAQIRYIFTQLSPVARCLFPVADEPLYNYLFDDNLRIEPEYYAPIIPMVLVNGASGIGTGWSTNIPNYNPRDLVENVKRMIRNEEPFEMTPWFKGYRGSIVQIGPQKFISTGELAILEDNKIEITELPIKTWTQTYKESVLEPYLNGGEKTPCCITDYKEYHTHATVRFVVSMNEAQFENARKTGFHKFFKLQSTFSTASMVLFDSKGVLRRFESAMEILEEFFTVRREFYYRRKRYQEGFIEAEAIKLTNQARFILEKNDGKLKMENVKKKDFINILIERGYDSDPIKSWKQKQQVIEVNEDDGNDGNNSNQQEEGDESNYEYLLSMRISYMLKENAEKLLKQRDDKYKDLDILRSTSPETLWERDLDAFLVELEKYEKGAEERSRKALLRKNTKDGKDKQAGGKVKKEPKVNSEDTKPSVFGERVEPEINMEQFKPKQPAGKGRKPKTEKAEDSNDSKEDDKKDDIQVLEEELSLSERIGTSPEMIERAKKNPIDSKNLKQTKLNFEKVAKPPLMPSTFDDIAVLDSDDEKNEVEPIKAPPKAKKPAAPKDQKEKKEKKPREPKPKKVKKSKAFSDSDDDKDFNVKDDDEVMEVDVAPQRATSGRTKKPSKYVFSSDESDDDSFKAAAKYGGDEDLDSTFDPHSASKRSSEELFDNLFPKKHKSDQ